MDRPEKVATPAATVTAEPPLSVPPAGLVPMVRLPVVALLEVSMLPLASSTATFTAGVMVEPAAVLAGPCTKASLAGGRTPALLKAAHGVAARAGSGAVGGAVATVLPLASSTATFTAGVMVEPAAVLAGPCTKASLA